MSSYPQAGLLDRGLQCTPIHWRLLQLVRDGRIDWRTSIGPYGGFAPADGSLFPPCDALVALYELRNAGLIGVDAEAGKVYLTESGMARLPQLSDWQRNKAS